MVAIDLRESRSSEYALRDAIMLSTTLEGPSRLIDLFGKLESLRGLYICLITAENYNPAKEPASVCEQIICHMISESFPKVCVIHGGWKALYQQILELPANLRRQLLVSNKPTKSKWESLTDDFKSRSVNSVISGLRIMNFYLEYTFDPKRQRCS